jgi:transposase-like protein
MKRTPSPFKWRHYAPDVILLCVRWYCRYSFSYRDLEEMMRERDLTLDHTTVWRWVQRYALKSTEGYDPLTACQLPVWLGYAKT